MNQTFHIMVKESATSVVKYDNSNLQKVNNKYDNSNLQKVNNKYDNSNLQKVNNKYDNSIYKR